MSSERRHFDTARHFAAFSKDPRTKCGCIATTKDGRLLSQGWNGFPRGIYDIPERWNCREVKHRYVVHAEQNCVFNAVHTGVSLAGSIFYVYAPIHVCEECAKAIVQCGVAAVYMALDVHHPTYGDPKWRDSWEYSRLILKEGGVEFFVYDYRADFDTYESSVRG